MARLLAYSPPWSPVQAYYRPGYGWGDNWHWAETQGGDYGNGEEAGSPWSQSYLDSAAKE